MSKFVKDLIEAELKKKITDDNAKDFVVVSTMGVSGNDNNMLRGELKSKGVKITVVPNTLFRKALRSEGLDSAAELFTGACAIAYGGDSIVDVAKEVCDWAKKIKAFVVKGAYVEGSSLDEKAAIELSKMPNRVELQGAVIMLAMSPARQLAGAITGPGGVIAGCLKAIADKEEAA